MLNSPIKNFSDSMKHYSTYQSQFIEMFDKVKDNKYGYMSYRLSDCCSYISDGSHYSPKEDPNGQYPMLSVKDMTEKGFTYKDCKNINKEEYDKLVANGCKPEINDVLVAKDGSYFKYSFALIEAREQAVLSSIAILRPNPAIVDSRYLAYYMLTPEVIRLVEQNYLTGTAIKRVILKGFKEIPVLTPPLDKQQEFVSILQQADKSKFSNLKSQFIEMFEGDKYPRISLDAIADEWLKGQAFKKDEICENGDKHCIHYGELFTKYGPVIKEVVSKTSVDLKKPSKNGDILFPASDVTPNGLARCSMLPYDNVVLGGDIIVLRPKEGYSPAYLSYAINQQTTQLLARVNGGLVKHLSAKGLKTVEIPIPSKEKQEEYIRIAEQADKSKYIN